MSTLLKPLLVREELLRRKLRMFSSQEIARVFGFDLWQTKYFLKRQQETGLLVQLKKGLYALKTDLPSEEEIANRLYQPSYLSFEYALAKYNILPEAVYTLTSATTMPTREFVVGDKVFTYLTIKKTAYTGYQAPVYIAEPEKALVDFWYFVAIGKKQDNDRLNLTGLDKKKIVYYAKLYNRPKLFKIVKNRIKD